MVVKLTIQCNPYVNSDTAKMHSCLVLRAAPIAFDRFAVASFAPTSIKVAPRASPSSRNYIVSILKRLKAKHKSP